MSLSTELRPRLGGALVVATHCVGGVGGGGDSEVFVRYTIRSNDVDIGAVELPVGLLVAARLEPGPTYAMVADTVRRATVAFLHRGVFGASAAAVGSADETERAFQKAMACGAALSLALIAPSGVVVDTSFINLLESPLDGGVVVLVSFLAAHAAVGSMPRQSSRRAAEGR